MVSVKDLVLKDIKVIKVVADVLVIEAELIVYIILQSLEPAHQLLKNITYNSTIVKKIAQVV